MLKYVMVMLVKKLVYVMLMTLSLSLLTGMAAGGIIIGADCLINNRPMTAERILSLLRWGLAVALGITLAAAGCSVFASKIRSKRLAKILREEGYSDNYYNAIIKMIKFGLRRRRTDDLLFLAGELSDGGRFADSLTVMNSIDLGKVTERQLAEYYNCYLYILLVNGEQQLAEKVYSVCRKLLIRYCEDKFECAAVLHTLGTLEYSRGEYFRAENLFLRARDESTDIEQVNICNMYLALIFLKTDRKEIAKKLVLRTIPELTELHQKREMLNLMKMVELAYDIHM